MTPARRAALLVAVLVLLGCSGTPDGPPLADVEMSAEDRACIDFYSSSSQSIEEEPTYFGRLAERIGELGHEEATVILDDVARQWEIGYWEPAPGDEQPEDAMSAQLAEAGGLLAAAGHIRCADLSEYWGIDGYRGQPSNRELFLRQRQIWDANGLVDYWMLLSEWTGGPLPTQYHVAVVGGQPSEVLDAVTGEPLTTVPPHVPLTVDQLYARMDDGGSLATRYDLVYSVPILQDPFLVSFDPNEFPEPQLEVFEET